MYADISGSAPEIKERLEAFMKAHIYPNEEAHKIELAKAKNRFGSMKLIERLKSKAQEEGLWNLFVPKSFGGLSNHEYAPLAEIMGRVFWSPEVFNCNAPDTGNMEVFMKYGNEAQREQWLVPLLKGEIRSAFVMTEPDVASSDATNIRTTILRDGDDYVINGRKWFITSALYERTKIFIVMGKSSPENPNRHLQQSQILVPKDTPGIKIERALTTLGYDEAPIGHAEVLFEDVRVPVENMLLGEGRGFEIAQGRLGPGRIHHCMRLIGAAQRSLEQACKRVTERSTFGKKLSEHQSIREEVAKSFAEIEQARQLTLLTAKKMDDFGAKNAKDLIAASKITVPLMAQTVIDRCMQMHGAGGLTEDYFMAEAFNYARWCRQADGPDQVHMMALGKEIIRRYSD
ncbi:MAG: acyl-CoA dehydrogenase family protein [Pseudomonadota bacterium]|nr:acyl-CoA dehydrogenase family protein [Pseudomonadota bacterium]